MVITLLQQNLNKWKHLRKQIDVWRKQQRNQTRVNKGFGRGINLAAETVKKIIEVVG